MTGNSALKRFADLQLSHAKLERLNLSFCCNLLDLSGIAQHCPTLQYLDLRLCESLQSLGDMLQHCPALQYLDLSCCSNLNVPSMKLPSLKILKLDSCDFLEELIAGAEPLHEQLPRLEQLCYSNCRHPLSVLPGLRGMSSLRKLKIKITKFFDFGKFMNRIAAELNALAQDLINLKTLEVYLHWISLDDETLENYLGPGCAYNLNDHDDF